MPEEITTLSQPNSTPNASFFLDTSTPNLARIFDFLLDGAAHFEVDRQAAERMVQVIPSLRKWVRLQRAFIQEAAQVLSEDGIHQFLDIGSGMPTDDHLHGLLQDAHIVYSDINPVAVGYGNGLFSQHEHVAYVYGDVRELDDLLTHPSVQQLIRLHQPVAIGLNFIPFILSPAENHQLAEKLYQWAPRGSVLFLFLQVKNNVAELDAYAKFRQMTADAGLPIQHYTLEECLEMMKPWPVARLEPITQFLGLPEDYITPEDKGVFDFGFYAAIWKKG